jgi:hypothetical protein
VWVREGVGPREGDLHNIALITCGTVVVASTKLWSWAIPSGLMVSRFDFSKIRRVMVGPKPYPILD